MTVKARVPKNASWHTEVRNILEENISIGSNMVSFPQKATLEYNLGDANGIKMDMNELAEKYDFGAQPYAYYAVMGDREGENIIDPIVFRLSSAKTDSFLDNVLESLRGAASQFSGTRVAIISCMLPELESFSGLQNASAIQKMTYYFFDHYADNFINAVSYVSDPFREVDGIIINSDRPSLSFRNHKFSEKFGPENIPIYQ